MHNPKTPPILDFKLVLLGQVKAKLKQVISLPLYDTTLDNDLALELCTSSSNQEIMKLLENDSLLKNAILNLKTDGNTKQTLGAELFDSVLRYDTSLCAQITGMLLDLDVFTICDLLSDSEALERAILKAKKEYMNYKQGYSKDYIGEEIYKRAFSKHSDAELASRLTGILLELDISCLQCLLDNPEQLDNRLDTALRAIEANNAKLGGLTPPRSMASEEHQALATFIKGVHQSLRVKSRELGADRAWLEHCRQTQLLQKYAVSMKQLATEHWEKKYTDDKSVCRIKWVVDQCTEYFVNKGHEKSASKEGRMSQIYFKKSRNQVESMLKPKPVLRLLDVGSCYNPFSKFSIFDVTALDIVPASDEVYKCDFLSVNISKNVQIKNPCLELPRMYFDIVVFSLLLEYMPSSKQRFKCCKNAFELLKPEGLLFILTPDSKHATANSRVMKSWRFALASIGFWRVSYQKMKHLHCMAYRRCLNPEVPRHWLSMRPPISPLEELLCIPQDFQVYQDRHSSGDELVETRSESDNQLIVDSFSGFPGSDIFID